MIPRVIVVLLFAQSANQDELLVRGRDRILAAIDRMPSYTCTQTVDRSEFEPVTRHPEPLSCDQLVARHADGLAKLDLVRTDRLRLDVQVSESGFERFSWPFSSRVSSEHVQDFAAGGLFGTGAFGPFLIDIFAEPGVTFWPEGVIREDGGELRQYRYSVPLASSHYRVLAGGSTRVVPFEGHFWLDTSSADIRRLSVRTAGIPRSTANCEAATTVDFARVAIGSGEHLLANRSVLHVIRLDAVEQENVTTYSACHEFHGESAIRFEGDEATAPAATSAGASNQSSGVFFPAGVRVTIRFAGGIDRLRSAAGDLLVGKAFHTDPNPKKRLLVAAGAPVHCRITRLENDLREARLSVLLACESIEWNGRWVPFAAVPDLAEDLSRFIRKVGQATTATQRRAYPAHGPAFLFPTGDPDSEKGPFTLDGVTIDPH